MLTYVSRKVAEVSGEDPKKYFFGQNVSRKMKEAKEDAYKEDMKKKKEFEKQG
jgi:hypothetical protein